MELRLTSDTGTLDGAELSGSALTLSEAMDVENVDSSSATVTRAHISGPLARLAEPLPDRRLANSDDSLLLEPDRVCRRCEQLCACAKVEARDKSAGSQLQLPERPGTQLHPGASSCSCVCVHEHTHARQAHKCTLLLNDDSNE